MSKWPPSLRKTQKNFLEYRYKKPSFCNGGVDRIKRLSYEVLDKHKSKFNDSFTDNKKLLDQIAIIRSKGLKNEVAGYITKFIKKEIREEEFKQSQIAQAKEDSAEIEVTPEIEETTEIESPPTEESEETVIEVGVDNIDTPETTETLEEKTE